MYSVIYDHQAFCLQQYGGVSRYFCEISSRVNQAADFSARIVAPVHFNHHLSESDAEQTSVYLPMVIPRTGALYRSVSNFVSPIITRTLKPSVVHQTYFGPQHATPGALLVLTVFDMIHELFPDSFPADDRTRRNKRLCTERANHILCISESTADDLARLCDVPREKISVTHLGCSDIFRATPQARDKPAHGRPYLLYVGQRFGYKNFSLALKAYASSKRLRGECDLVVFGGAPFDAAELALIASLQLDAARIVRLVGSDADLARAYRNARAFVYPSLYEGFGIPLLEAMSSACAVACSNTSSIPEVVGNAASLFDPHDVDSIRQALETTCLDEDVRARLVSAGLKRVCNFSWDRCAADTLAAYRRILGAASPAG